MIIMHDIRVFFKTSLPKKGDMILMALQSIFSFQNLRQVFIRLDKRCYPQTYGKYKVRWGNFSKIASIPLQPI